MSGMGRGGGDVGGGGEGTGGTGGGGGGGIAGGSTGDRCSGRVLEEGYSGEIEKPEVEGAVGPGWA